MLMQRMRPSRIFAAILALVGFHDAGKEKTIAAVALLCDNNGVVRQILDDSLSAGEIAAGQSLESRIGPRKP